MWLGPGDGVIHIMPYPYLPRGSVSVAAKREPGEIRILPYPYPGDDGYTGLRQRGLEIKRGSGRFIRFSPSPKRGLKRVPVEQYFNTGAYLHKI